MFFLLECADDGLDILLDLPTDLIDPLLLKQGTASIMFFMACACPGMSSIIWSAFAVLAFAPAEAARSINITLPNVYPGGYRPGCPGLASLLYTFQDDVTGDCM